MTLSLGFSPCPNDCFMFDAMVHGRIDVEGLEFDVRMADIEALNAAAFAGEIDVTKLSFHAYAYCADSYLLLDAGSALGRGCGPLLIARRSISHEEVATGKLKIAIPGRYTTAHFLLNLAFPQARDKVELLFSDIEDAVLDGRVDAGLIIHENRFTYAQRGLKQIIDLGEFWESETGTPIPLGGIVVNRRIPADIRQKVNRVMRRSVEYAFAHRADSLPFVRAHAQAMSDDVMYQHIDLYVNEHSVDLGPEGRRAVEVLFERARRLGVVPAAVREDLFSVSERLSLETDRLLFRAPGSEDARAIFERYAADPEVTRYMAWPRHRSIADSDAFVSFSEAEWKRWPAGPLLAFSRENGRLLGGAGLLFETPECASTGYVFARDAWGRGFATESLAAMVDLAAALGVKRLHALCHPEHRVSARVMEKCGFKREGILPRHTVFPNLSLEPIDVVSYARILNS